MLGTDAEDRPNVVPHALGGRRGQGETSCAREPVADLSQAAVFRPEVVAPFRDAVGFVDREKVDPALFEKYEYFRSQESLRGDVQQPRLAAADLVHRGSIF